MLIEYSIIEILKFFQKYQIAAGETIDLSKTTILPLANAKIYDDCLQKIETQIQQLSRRHLSLRGKAILLNSLILPKVTFLSNVFPINNEIQKQLEKQIFEHLWQFTKKEPIARATLFLPKKQGGIGLIHWKHHSLAMRDT